MHDAPSKRCAEVAEHLAELLDGTAPAPLIDHVVECDHCRDTKHEAEAALRATRSAAGDYVVPPDLAARVLSATENAAVAPKAETPHDVSDAKVAPERAEKSTKTAPPARPLAFRRERRVAAGLVAIALAAAAALVVRAQKSSPETATTASASSWHGQLAQVATVGGAGVYGCGSHGKCSALPKDAKITPGMRVGTDAKTRAELTMSDGSRITLDRDTEIQLSSAAPREAKLLRGGLVADITHSASEARFDLPNGALTVHGTKFALRADRETAAVDVVRGSVTLSDREEQRVRVEQGESGRIEAGLPPFVGASSGLGEALAWREDSFERRAETVEAPRGLGQLRAKKPGEANERKGAVTLSSHSVRVRIAGAIARTEIEEVFENGTDEVLEGIYRFPLPPKAQIERLALEVDGRFEEGAFVERDRAAAIWRGAIVNSAPKPQRPLEEIVWVPGPWRDPALLEWQRGGRFELRIFPIPKRSSRRVILAYTEVVASHLGTRRYTYPLAYDPSGTTRVGRFDVNVEVRGHDPRFGVRPAGYALTAGSSGDGAGTLALSAQNFAPSGDLSFEYALPDRNAELTAFTYHDQRSGTLPAAGKSQEDDDRSPYVAFSLRPKLPRTAKEGAHSVALVVDSSRSMLGESYRRATELAARIVSELDPDDRVTLLACGVECRSMPGGARTPGSATADEVRRFLAGIVPEDGSDLVGAAERALESLAAGGRSRRVLYLGDGAPTVGQIRPGSVERGMAEIVRRLPGQVTAVAVGGESDQVTLAALSRGGGGVLVPYVPGASVAEAAYAVLGASSGRALSDVSVELPEGLRAVAPRRVDAILAGSEAFVVARMDNLELAGDVVLRGRVGGASFEQRYPLKLAASNARGNAFVPRLYAATRITDLEREGTSDAKREAVALSSRFNVASRYTSLLVLESEAMFKAFGLDNRRSAPLFSGEEEAEASTASGAFEVDADAPGGDLGLSGLGSGGGGRAKSSGPMPAPAATSGRLSADDFAESESRRAEGAPLPAPKPMSPEKKKESSRSLSDPFVLEDRPSRRRMVPMRRVWERFGEVVSDRVVPSRASSDALGRAERELELDENRREAVKKLFTLSLAAGDLTRAGSLAERWSSKDPLDPEAITARADVLAARGERAEAIRVLGGVLDVRPDDIAAQKRLARLARWAGKAALGCRYTLASAELRPGDATLLADAVRCARETGAAASADELLLAADAATRSLAETKLAQAASDDRALKGDLRVEAGWSGNTDLDLALIDPDGHRVSWLGAPTRAVISARDVTSRSTETLALSGGKPGEYAIELVRVGTGERASGEITITVAGTTRRVPFTLDGDRVKVAIAKIGMRSKLVPL